MKGNKFGKWAIGNVGEFNKFYEQYVEIAKKIEKCKTMDRVREKFEDDDEDRYCDISEMIFIRYKDIEIKVVAMDYDNFEYGKCGIDDRFKYYDESGEEIGTLSWIGRLFMA